MTHSLGTTKFTLFITMLSLFHSWELLPHNNWQCRQVWRQCGGQVKGKPPLDTIPVAVLRFIKLSQVVIYTSAYELQNSMLASLPCAAWGPGELAEGRRWDRKTPGAMGVEPRFTWAIPKTLGRAVYSWSTKLPANCSCLGSGVGGVGTGTTTGSGSCCGSRSGSSSSTGSDSGSSSGSGLGAFGDGGFLFTTSFLRCNFWCSLKMERE